MCVCVLTLFSRELCASKQSPVGEEEAHGEGEEEGGRKREEEGRERGREEGEGQ